MMGPAGVPFEMAERGITLPTTKTSFPLQNDLHAPTEKAAYMAAFSVFRH
jgi:hypothetical protein